MSKSFVIYNKTTGKYLYTIWDEGEAVRSYESALEDAELYNSNNNPEKAIDSIKEWSVEFKNADLVAIPIILTIDFTNIRDVDLVIALSK